MWFSRRGCARHAAEPARERGGLFREQLAPKRKGFLLERKPALADWVQKTRECAPREPLSPGNDALSQYGQVMILTEMVGELVQAVRELSDAGSQWLEQLKLMAQVFHFLAPLMKSLHAAFRVSVPHGTLRSLIRPPDRSEDERRVRAGELPSCYAPINRA